MLRALHQFDCPDDVPEIDAPQLLNGHSFRAVDPLLAALDRAACLEYVEPEFIEQTRSLVLETVLGDRAVRPTHLRARRPHLRERAVGRPRGHRAARLRVVAPRAGGRRPRRLPALRQLPLPARGRGLRGRDPGHRLRRGAVLDGRGLPRAVRVPARVRSPPPLLDRLRRARAASRSRRPGRSARCRRTTRTAASSARSAGSVTSTGWRAASRPIRWRSTPRAR